MGILAVKKIPFTNKLLPFAVSNFKKDERVSIFET